LLYEFYSNPQSLGSIVRQTMTRYFRLVACLAPLLLLFVLCKDMGFYIAPNLSHSPWFGVLQTALLCAMFLLGYRLSHNVITSAGVSYVNAIKQSYKPILMIILMIVLTIVFIVGLHNALVFVARYFTVDSHYIAAMTMFLLMFLSIPLLFILTKLSQVLPLMLADNYSFADAMQVGTQLIKGNFLIAFKPVALILLFYLFSSNSTQHAHYFYQVNLLIPFDYLTMLIVMPIFYGVALLSLADFQLRDKLAGN
jgi:hypothetical protein